MFLASLVPDLSPGSRRAIVFPVLPSRPHAVKAAAPGSPVPPDEEVILPRTGAGALPRCWPRKGDLGPVMVSPFRCHLSDTVGFTCPRSQKVPQARCQRHRSDLGGTLALCLSLRRPRDTRRSPLHADPEARRGRSPGLGSRRHVPSGQAAPMSLPGSLLVRKMVLKTCCNNEGPWAEGLARVGRSPWGR